MDSLTNVLVIPHFSLAHWITRHKLNIQDKQILSLVTESPDKKLLRAGWLHPSACYFCSSFRRLNFNLRTMVPGSLGSLWRTAALWPGTLHLSQCWGPKIWFAPQIASSSLTPQVPCLWGSHNLESSYRNPHRALCPQLQLLPVFPWVFSDIYSSCCIVWGYMSLRFYSWVIITS